MMPPCEPPGGCLGIFLYSSGFLSCHLRLAWGHGIQAGHRADMAPIPSLQKGWKLSLWVNKPQVRQTDMALIAPTINTSSSTQSWIQFFFPSVWATPLELCEEITNKNYAHLIIVFWEIFFTNKKTSLLVFKTLYIANPVSQSEYK